MKKLKIKKTIILYFMFLMVMLIVIMNKKNFHVDEIFSYTLSNGTWSMTFEEDHTYSPAGQIYLDNMMVNNASEMFNFSNVWKNQTNDVHPPLYYVLMHIISSVYVGRFSVWVPGIINICFAMGTFHILRKLMCQFCDDSIVVNISSIMYILSVGILQNVSFFRMYVVAMFWVTLIAYLFILALDKTHSWKLWLGIGLSAVAGALTHYYCIIYLCITCLVFGICLLIQKRWKDISKLVCCMMISAGVAITIFPAMLTHMFSGYRGTESISNITNGTLVEHWNRIQSFYNLINTQALGDIGGSGIVFALLIIVLLVILHERQKPESIIFDKTLLMKLIIIGIPIIFYFCFVSISAVYVADRYLFPIYTVTFALFLVSMYVLWRELIIIKYVYIVLCLIGTMFIVNGFSNADWNYLYKSSTDLLKKAQEHSDRNCICIYDEQWKVQPAFCEIKNYKSVTFVSQGHYDNILQHGDLYEDGFMLNIIGGNDDKIISIIQNSYPYLNKYEKIGGFAYSTTYYIFAGEESHNVHIYDYGRNGEIGANAFALCSNVLLTQKNHDIWLIMQDQDHAVIEMDKFVLDITGATYIDGTNIQLYSANHSDAQIWRIVRNDDGSFSLLAKDEKLALAYGENGNIYLAEYYKESDLQKWWIE